MRYIPDVTFNIQEQLSDEDKAARIISNTTWHRDSSLSQYFNYKTGAVLCISSLTDPEELKNLLDNCDKGNVVYFVRISQAMRHFAPLNWLGRLLFLPTGDRLAKLRTTWSFSPIRYQLLKKEKEIESILNKSNVTIGVI